METKVSLRCSLKCAKKATNWVTSTVMGLEIACREACAKWCQLARIITKNCDIIKIPQSKALGGGIATCQLKRMCLIKMTGECRSSDLCRNMILLIVELLIFSKTLSLAHQIHRCQLELKKKKKWWEGIVWQRGEKMGGNVGEGLSFKSLGFF